MPSFPVLSPSTYEVVISGNAAGAADSKNVVNVLHYSQTVGPPANNGQLTNFLVALATNLAPAWAAAFPNAYTVGSVSARWMEDSTTAPSFEPTPNVYGGSGGMGDIQPADSSWFMEKQTNFKSRSARGGIHFSPILESNTTDFTLLAAFQTGAAASLKAALEAPQNWTDSFIPYAFSPFLVSRKNSTLVPAGTCIINGAAIINFRIRKTMGSMNRRKVRGRY